MDQQQAPARRRVGLVGAGGISGAHLPYWLSINAQIFVYSTEHAERLVANNPEADVTIVNSLEELLDQVDIVDIMTPTPDHYAPTKAALAAGKKVVCEKPLTRHTGQAKELLELAEPGQLYPAHVVRYFPQYAHAKRIIDEGTLGELGVLRFTRRGSYPTRDWYADPERSGGIVMDQMIHDLDQAYWLAGPVERLYAVNRVLTDPEKIETCHVVMHHTNGAVSHCRGLWGNQRTVFGYSYDIYGTEGRLRFDTDDSAQVRLDDALKAKLAAEKPDKGFLPSTSAFDSPYSTELAAYVAAFDGGELPRVSAEDGLMAVALCEAATASIESGAPIVMKEFLA
ncbi:Gfo/Idh/MocA family protein [Parenemella sanctibonifatiensis]|uniref:Dehydrogenase n=1 Tax=Parenemella sanctibonifatiensis TaxID=2016505 RepID=A0A255EC30_9ACTN|nr:Gfo/Idh/MocA family oxidoreductase [Parenemella sanctibonifatiensis]OYN88820.1 dehydrogenase [Parenemella sanctibonifatiensis]